LGESLQRAGFRWHLVCNGDDVVLIVDQRDVSAALEMVQYGQKQCGFELGEPSVCTVFERIVFDQCSPVQVSANSWVMVRDPLRILGGLCYTCRRFKYGEYLSWLLAVARGEYALNWWVPCLGSMLRSMINDLSSRGVQAVDLEKVDRNLAFKFRYQEYGHVDVDPSIVAGSCRIRNQLLLDLGEQVQFVCPTVHEFGSHLEPRPTLITAGGSLFI